MIGRDAVVVLQARYASRRLPGKALALLAGRPIVARCLDRLRAGGVAPVVLATTTNPEDDPLALLAFHQGTTIVRGPESDVLRRFVLATTRAGASYVVRATADNPAVDIDAPRRVLDALVRSGADYVVEVGLPYGTCVEAMTGDALKRADALATTAEEREHVTVIMRRDRRFRALEVPAPPQLCAPHLRLTIDTPSDLDFMRRVMLHLGHPDVEPSLAAIIEAVEAIVVTAEAVA